MKFIEWTGWLKKCFMGRWKISLSISSSGKALQQGRWNWNSRDSPWSVLLPELDYFHHPWETGSGFNAGFNIILRKNFKSSSCGVLPNWKLKLWKKQPWKWPDEQEEPPESPIVFLNAVEILQISKLPEWLDWPWFRKVLRNLESIWKVWIRWTAWSLKPLSINSKVDQWGWGLSQLRFQRKRIPWKMFTNPFFC